MVAQACGSTRLHADAIPSIEPSVEDDVATASSQAASPGIKKTFYKRKLPTPPAVAFSSAEGRSMFQEALAAGHMTGFFKLIEQYSTQDEPAFCGLSSLTMVLNALAIDPRRKWKGSWRWFHEKLLDCCLPLERVAMEGITLTQAACLAQCNGARVTLNRHGSFSLDQFRAQLKDVCSSGQEHIIVSYSRRPFLQTGDGHFSPVGGYYEASDMALILDTARFKYPPHWLPVPMLYDAMSLLDAVTGQPRGYLRLAAHMLLDSVLFSLDIRTEQWREAGQFISRTAFDEMQALASSGQHTAEQVLRRLIQMAPLDSVNSFVVVRLAAAACAKDRCVPHGVREQVLVELRSMPLYKIVVDSLKDATAPGGDTDFLAEKLCMLLLLHPTDRWSAAWADAAQGEQWQQLLDATAISIVETEVLYLREQLQHIDDVIEGGSLEPACGTCKFSLDCSVKGHDKLLPAPVAAVGALPQAFATDCHPNSSGHPELGCCG